MFIVHSSSHIITLFLIHIRWRGQNLVLYEKERRIFSLIISSEMNIMDDDLFEGVLACIKSQTRRKVIELLLENPHGLRFSEISTFLNIYPSTLEKHLSKLVATRAVSHHDNLYLATVNSLFLWSRIKKIQNLDSNSYLSSHLLPLANENLRVKFGSLEFDVIPDLISIINLIRNDFSEKQSLIQAGGNLDYHIGKSVYGSGMLDHSQVKVEIILTHELIDRIRTQGEEDIFLGGFNERTTWLYEIKECNLGLGVGTSSGFLFLPTLDLKVDYNQCLYSRSSDSLSWLRELFDNLKKQSIIFNP